jgi:hypothetical protein
MAEMANTLRTMLSGTIVPILLDLWMLCLLKMRACGRIESHAPGSFRSASVSDPRSRSHAHFRYRIEGPTETEEILDSVFKDVFGPNCNKEREKWIRRLRRFGLIGQAMTDGMESTL